MKKIRILNIVAVLAFIASFVSVLNKPSNLTLSILFISVLFLLIIQSIAYGKEERITEFEERVITKYLFFSFYTIDSDTKWIGRVKIHQVYYKKLGWVDVKFVK